MKRLVFVLILFASVLTGALIPFSAHAESPYDSISYASDMKWTIGGNQCDYTTEWFSRMVDSYTGSKDLVSMIDYDLYNWMVIKWDDGNSLNYQFIAVARTVQTYNGGSFGSVFGGQMMYGVPVNWPVLFSDPQNYAYINVVIDSSCNVQSSSDSGQIAWTDFNNGDLSAPYIIGTGQLIPYYGIKILFTNFNFLTPPGFQGTPPPDVYTLPLQPRPEIPDLNIITASGYNLVVQDRNFNTFDQAPTLCVSELAPVIHYKLYERVPNSDILVDSGTMSPTVQYTRQLEKKAAKYRFEAQYDCGQGDYSFITAAQKDFEMNDFGALVRECSTDVAGFFCRMSSDLKFGVFSTTFQGLNTILSSMQTINPSNCNTNWIATAHFQSNILPVQNFPQQVCQFAQNMYLTSGKPFYTINQWLNIVLQGAAILLLVFGLLAIFGFKVRLPSPIGEEDGTDIRPDIATSSSISRHRGTYSRTPSSTRSTDATFTPGNSGKWHDRNPERWR